MRGKINFRHTCTEQELGIALKPNFLTSGGHIPILQAPPAPAVSPVTPITCAARDVISSTTDEHARRVRFIRGFWVNELKESNMAGQEQECKQTDVDKGIVVCALVNELKASQMKL